MRQTLCPNRARTFAIVKLKGSRAISIANVAVAVVSLSKTALFAFAFDELTKEPNEASVKTITGSGASELKVPISLPQ